MKLVRIAMALVLSALIAAPALAQAYPNRPVRLVVPFPAGGGVDTMARIVGNKLSERIGQPVLVEHRPGAGGTLGADAVAKAAPDGYTVLITVNALAISAALYKTLPFDRSRPSSRSCRSPPTRSCWWARQRCRPQRSRM